MVRSNPKIIILLFLPRLGSKSLTHIVETESKIKQNYEMIFFNHFSYSFFFTFLHFLAILFLYFFIVQYKYFQPKFRIGMWLGLVEAPPAYVWEGSKSAVIYSNWDSKQPDNSPGVFKLCIL